MRRSRRSLQIVMLSKKLWVGVTRRAADIFSRSIFFPLCFIFGDLYKLALFYIGLAYKDNLPYRLIYASGCAAFALFCGVAFLGILRTERPGAFRLWLPASALMYFALAFILGFARGAAADTAYELCLFILRCLPVFFAGVTLALRGGEDGFAEGFERLGFIALPGGIIYLVCALFDCNIFTDGVYLGLINYMSLAYTFMPVMLCALMRFYDGGELRLPYPGARPLPRPQLWRGGMILIFWVDIIASGTRGAYLCCALCCVAVFVWRLINRRRAICGFILSAAMAAIIIFTVFIYAPPGMRGVKRIDIFLSGLQNGELTTTDTEDPTVSDRVDQALDNIIHGSGGGGLEIDHDVRISDRATIYKLSLAEFLRSPASAVFGIGPCVFRAKYGVYPHNIFLQMLCETGILGTLPLLLLMTLAAVGMFRAARMRRRTRPGMAEILLLLGAYFVRENISNSIWQSAPLAAALGLGLTLFASLRRSVARRHSAGDRTSDAGKGDA